MYTNQIISSSESDFEKSIQYLKEEYSRLQVGRANPSLLENILVEVYGSQQPLKAIASITVPDPASLLIQPWDKSTIIFVEKAIVASNLGLSPVNDGVNVRINIPPLTEERRKELCKKVKELAETSRVSIRTSRQEAVNQFKKLQTGGEITEDDFHASSKKLQEKVDEANKKIDEFSTKKEEDILKI